MSNIILQGCRNSPLKSANFQKIDKLARLKSQKKETKKTMNVEPYPFFQILFNPNGSMMVQIDEGSYLAHIFTLENSTMECYRSSIWYSA